jgi:surfeit locus 1 family protein
MATTPTRSSPQSERHRAWVVLLGAVLVAGLTARLGVWQLDRATQKRVLEAAIAAQAEAPPLPADALPATAADAERLRHRRIQLRGHWLAAQSVYLDNRQMNGRPGFFVLTPLRLPAGDVVVVQRGWVPRHFTERTRIAPFTTPSGEVTVTGRVAPWPSRLTDLGPEAPGPIRQNLDLAAFAAETRLPLRPLAIIELGASDGSEQASQQGSPDGLMRDWPRPAVDVHKHYGYAAQWFGLSALTTGLYVWFQLIQPWRRRRSGASAGA